MQLRMHPSNQVAMRKVLLAVVLGLGFWLTFLPGCRKETEVVTYVHHDTVYVQPDMCPDTTLPINCYTTYLRGQGQRLPLGKEDTITVGMDQCITLGHCAFDTFIPTYRICLRAVSPGHIPDTAMCRAAGLPLCCPAYKPPPDDVGGGHIDLVAAYFEVRQICGAKQRVIFNQLGITQHLPHPDANPNFSCQLYLDTLLEDVPAVYWFKNCSFRFIRYPDQFDYDTIREVYLPQGPPNVFGEPSLIPCCAGDFKNKSNPGFSISDIYTIIGLQCN